VDRRIDLTKQNHDPQAALKQIAGLIQKLSYREMMALGKIVAEQLAKHDGIKSEDMAETMLDVADAILPREPANKPDPHARPFR
jgi:hypothetical protein